MEKKKACRGGGQKGCEKVQRGRLLWQGKKNARGNAKVSHCCAYMFWETRRGEKIKGGGGLGLKVRTKEGVCTEKSLGQIKEESQRVLSRKKGRTVRKKKKLSQKGEVQKGGENPPWRGQQPIGHCYEKPAPIKKLSHNNLGRRGKGGQEGTLRKGEVCGEMNVWT